MVWVRSIQLNQIAMLTVRFVMGTLSTTLRLRIYRQGARLAVVEKGHWKRISNHIIVTSIAAICSETCSPAVLLRDCGSIPSLSCALPLFLRSFRRRGWRSHLTALLQTIVNSQWSVWGTLCGLHQKIEKLALLNFIAVGSNVILSRFRFTK